MYLETEYIPSTFSISPHECSFVIMVHCVMLLKIFCLLSTTSSCDLHLSYLLCMAGSGVGGRIRKITSWFGCRTSVDDLDMLANREQIHRYPVLVRRKMKKMSSSSVLLLLLLGTALPLNTTSADDARITAGFLVVSPSSKCFVCFLVSGQLMQWKHHPLNIPSFCGTETVV